jgi:hypothetical protein
LYLYFSGNNIQCYNVYTFSEEYDLRELGCYRRYSEENIFSFSLTSEKEPITCLSLTYILKSSNNRKYELMIFDQLLKKKIFSVELEKGVSTIIIIFYTIDTSTFTKTRMNNKIYFNYRTI